MQGTVELAVSVLKADSTFLLIKVVKCVLRKESVATVNVFLPISTWSEVCSESSFGGFSRRCNRGMYSKSQSSAAGIL